MFFLFKLVIFIYNWNVGILEPWNNGFWESGLLIKSILTEQLKKSTNNKIPLKTNIPLFHHSICETIEHASINPFSYIEL
jgi:hypothetical protein